MKNFIQPGDTLTLLAPRTLATAGLGILVGALFAVAVNPAASGAAVESLTEGVFDLPKAAGAITQGAKVYWDNTAFNVTTTSSGNTLIGVATQAAASGDATARIRLGIVA
jgi:predicted RecA/RadA family phage recombinase